MQHLSQHAHELLLLHAHFEQFVSPDYLTLVTEVKEEMKI